MAHTIQVSDKLANTVVSLLQVISLKIAILEFALNSGMFV
jgi:hypothetical protein